MKYDDNTDGLDWSRLGVDIPIRETDPMSPENQVLEEILREFGTQKAEPQEAPRAESKKPVLPPIDDPLSSRSDQDSVQDSGTYRTFDGSREYRSFDITLPEASPEEWYQVEDDAPEGGEYDLDDYDEDEKAARRPRKRHPVLRAIGHTLLVIATLLSVIYLVVIYSNIPAVNRLRTMYIQTAMSTIGHKWLATAIIPNDLILDVMLDQYETAQAMEGVNSSWGTVVIETLPEFEQDATSPATVPAEDSTTPGTVSEPEEEVITPEEQTFFELFWELDRDSVKRYLSKHPEALANGWAGIDINESGLDDSGTDMVTIYGDQVLAINAVDGITLVRLSLSPNRSRGVLAICKDTSRLSLCPASTLGTVGQTAGRICDNNDGILSITGSAFMDDGYANGGQISGLAVCSGTVYGERLGEAGDKRLELRGDNKMYIVDSSASLGEGTRDACEFHPGLIIDGTIYYNDFWSGPNPRAVLGQSSRLETMMVVLEGRLTTSLGCGVDYISDKLAEYGCVQALNLDGGTSAIMYYKGEYITLCSNPDLPGGRTLPTAWVYKPAS